MEAIESEKSLLEIALENNATRLLQQIKGQVEEDHKRLEVLQNILGLQAATLEDGLTTFHDSISAIIRDSNARLLTSICTIRQHQEIQVTSTEQLRIVEWLSNVDHTAHQRQIPSMQAANTGRWLLESEMYQRHGKQPKEVRCSARVRPEQGRRS